MIQVRGSHGARLFASLVVEDTPDRQSKHKKRSDLILKTPPSTTSRRKRRAQSRSPVSTPITPLNLDEEGTSKQALFAWQIFLEICFEPSTTLSGHSFCKKCLRLGADKCGKKCPKCRQLISNGRSCNVDTVLWNPIQLLFPQEVEARKAAGALNGRKVSVKVQRVELVVPEELQVLDLQWSLPVLEMQE
ncbi:hypothetical protein POUND7_020723 [Theobroma cacao]